MNSSAELDPMAEMNELDDLGNLFEFGDIDLNTISDSGQYGDHMQQQHGTHPNTPFQEISEAPAMGGTSAHDFSGHEQYAMSQSMPQQTYMRQHDNHAPNSHSYTSEATYQPSIQQPYHPYTQPFQFAPPLAFPPGHHVPPTPNSYEMHGETGRFMQQQPQLDPQQRAILEQRYHLRKDDAIAFTPMVSPAGTPQYNMLPEYTTPGAYFSPLTSPMLHAQNQQQQAQPRQSHRHHPGYATHPNTAPSSSTSSPIDPNIDVEMLESMALPESTGVKTRKSRRKMAPQRSTSAATKIKQSPSQNAQKPQKRKTVHSLGETPHSRPTDYLQRSVTSQPTSGGLQMPSQFDSSEAESISPEPLSESVMGPPPRPGSSLTQSPSLVGQQQQQQQQQRSGTVAVGAATPKSLLTMRGSQQPINSQQSPTQNLQAPNGRNGLDELSLPEAASLEGRRKPSLTQINTSLAPVGSDENTPRLSARKTPKLGPLSTPASGRPTSASLESPSVMGSPMTASTPSAILKDKKGSKDSRNGKKRGSVSANSSKLVSPALVPKISPSIKPLLPEGTPLTSATQAMLLASKSNYQNLLEGNHLPGVTYPDSLSTGLTSKRTSHKVAEQGRRNRINEALKEMQCLVPKSAISRSPNTKDLEGENLDGSPNAILGDDDDKGIDGKEKDEGGAKSNSSKAATVELANEYIKKMQKDVAAQSAEMSALRRENEELRKRLGVDVVGGTPSVGESGSSRSTPSEKVL